MACWLYCIKGFTDNNNIHKYTFVYAEFNFCKFLTEIYKKNIKIKSLFLQIFNKTIFKLMYFSINWHFISKYFSLFGKIYINIHLPHKCILSQLSPGMYLIKFQVIRLKTSFYCSTKHFNYIWNGIWNVQVINRMSSLFVCHEILNRLVIISYHRFESVFQLKN